MDDGETPLCAAAREGHYEVVGLLLECEASVDLAMSDGSTPLRHANLQDFLAVDENRHLFWQKFYEVSRGFKFLHERGVFLKDLRCEDVWSATDGVAKISRLGAGARSEASARGSQRVRWQSPECIQGGKATTASSVYALGMCIIEAVTRAIPYDEDRGRDVTFKVVVGYRPERPKGLTTLQWGLIERMLLGDSAKRVKLSLVAEQLHEFATQKQPRDQKTKKPSTQHSWILKGSLFLETL